MLTSTYSLVALAAEQDIARSMLCKLQQCVQNAWHGLDRLTLDTAFAKLVQFDRFWDARKLEEHLIPVLRCVTREADALLAELQALTAAAKAILQNIHSQLNSAIEPGGAKAAEICDAMDAYCDTQFARLNREEQALFPLARRLLSVEQWFSIAACLLADGDARGGMHATGTSRERAQQNRSGLN